ncbi:MAG: hypothetical protein JWN76_1847 [Chitinophagaceae bacterium]|nr:hypothetical protein [Chitinophagaceae bacterium]
MKLKIIFPVLSCFYMSCYMDSVSYADIINKTNGKITVCVYYNKNELRNEFKGSAYFDYLKGITKDVNGTLIDVDSNVIKQVYEIKAGQTNTLIKSNNSDPNFSRFRQLIIFSSNDTLNYSGSVSIKNAFVKTKNGDMELIVGK